MTTSTLMHNADRLESRRRFKDLIAVNFGNTLEWYDWTIYTIFAPYFAAQFFPSEDPVASLLAALAVFAIGFVTRPFGGFIFGMYADRVGRKRSLTLAMLITAVGSVAIALAPTFEMIGIFASLILLTARLAQGVAHGGEMGTSITYLVERAPANRRALYGSTSWMSVVTGTILATLTGLFLTSNLDQDQLASWGWRVAFGIGGLLGLYALYLRRRLVETEAFTASAETIAADPATTHQRSTVRALLRNWRGVLIVFGLSAGGSIMFYTWLIYTPTFAQVARGQDAPSALAASLLAQCFFLAVIPIVGILADKFGRRIFIAIFGVGFIALTFTLDGIIDGSFGSLLLAMVIALALIACLFGVNGAVWAEVFPTNVRASGVGGPLSLATAIFGGTAPYVNTLFSQNGQHHLFLVYLMVVAGITLLTAILMPETRLLKLEREDTGKLR